MIRITAGRWKGHPLKAPSYDHAKSGIRPTLAKTRQAIMNSLQLYLQDARILDLFAGSGALGFEALSRGAGHVVFVESARASLKSLSENISFLKANAEVIVISSEVEKAVDRIGSHGPYDLIFADPPYHMKWEIKLLNEFPWDKWLKPEGKLCLEWAPEKSKAKGGEPLPEETAFLKRVREKSYGITTLSTYILKN